VSEEFPARLRALVDEALPQVPIDPNLALDVARRRTRRTRVRHTVVSVAGAGFVVAGALALPAFTDEAPLVVASPQSVEMAPGIRAAASMVVVERDDDGAVYDTGIPAWGTADRFLFTTDGVLVTGVYVGGDEEIERLRDDATSSYVEGLPLVWDPTEGPSSGDSGDGVHEGGGRGTTFVVVSSPDESWRLVIGADTVDSALDPSTSTHLVARDVFTGPDGTPVSNVTLPSSAFTPAAEPLDVVHFAVVAHNTRGPAPLFAGTVSQTVESSSANVYSWGVNGCLFEKCDLAPVWSSATGATTENLVHDTTTVEIRERLGRRGTDDQDAWQRECLGVRTRADQNHLVARTELDRETQCRLDVAEARGRLASERLGESR